MPELPEVEVLALQLQKKVQGLKISEIVICQEAILKSSSSAFSELKFQMIQRISRRGKYLFFELNQNLLLWIHLGMTGQLFVKEAWDLRDPHLHLILRFENYPESMFLRDARRFGRCFLTGKNPEVFPKSLKQLGPELLDIQPDVFAAIYQKRKAPIKSLLLNQNLVTGFGNIYADEALFLAKIHPQKKASRLKTEALIHLREAAAGLMQDSIQHGGSSVNDYRHMDGSRGTYQKHFKVYGRQGQACKICGENIRRMILAGRSSFFCPQCQK